MSEIKFIDTSLRDGNQSLWDATGLNTENILTLAGDIDRAGFYAVDLVASTHMQTAVRYHKENPWKKVRLASKAMPNTRLCFGTTGRRFVGFKRSPDSIMELVYKCMAANGIRRVWLCEAALEMESVVKNARMAKAAGIEEFMVGLSYSISPVHTDDFYAGKTAEVTQCSDVDFMYIKDQGGLLTPDSVRTLINAVRPNLNGRLLEIHTHCNTGLGPLVYLEAVRLGIDRIHTGVPPLANGTAQPSVFNVLKNIKHMGHTANLDEDAIRNYSANLMEISEKNGKQKGAPLEYDLAYYDHQVPGGMATTLRRQLSESGAIDKLEQVLEEIVKVRKELGYPIMVTPLSQFVATQATFNVLSGKRYKTIPDGIIEYIAGYHGKPPAPVDQDVLDKIYQWPKTKKIMEQVFPQPSVQEIRSQMGIGRDVSDEEFLLRYAMSADEVNAMLAANTG